MRGRALEGLRERINTSCLVGERHLGFTPHLRAPKELFRASKGLKNEPTVNPGARIPSPEPLQLLQNKRLRDYSTSGRYYLHVSPLPVIRLPYTTNP